jgi:hypothetical protein
VQLSTCCHTSVDALLGLPPLYPWQSRAVAVACCVDCVLACCVLAVNDSDWHSGGGLILPSYQPSVHGKVSLQSCAMACHAAKLTIAGVNAGSDCFCGVSSDMQSAAARARNRPKSECMASACDADPGDKVSERFPATHTHCISMAYLTGKRSRQECGGPGRLLAYQFSCN